MAQNGTKFSAVLEPEKETKNTFRFTEVAQEGEPPVLGTLYIPKWVLSRLGHPETVKVTIEKA